MEIAKTEVSAIENIELEAAEKAVLDLGELQLLVIGGGCGEVVVG